MLAEFKQDIIKDFCVTQLDFDHFGSFIAVSFMPKYNRLDLLTIVFSETDQFNEYTDFANLASKYANLKAIKFLSDPHYQIWSS